MKIVGLISFCAAAAVILGGCTSKSDSINSQRIADYLKSRNDRNSTVTNETNGIMIRDYVLDKKTAALKMLPSSGESKEYQYFNIRTGDSVDAIFERMGAVDHKTYVVGQDMGFSAKFDTDGIKNLEDLSMYLLANEYKLITESIEKSNYVRVGLSKMENNTERKLSKIPVGIFGMVGSGEAIDAVAQSAGVPVSYMDKSASDISQASHYVNFKGNGLDAIRQVANKAGLGIECKNDHIEISYFETQAMDVDIFVRDRSMASTINNTPNKQPQGGGAQASSIPGVSVPTASGSTASGMMQDLKVAYATTLFKELKGSIESSLSKHGSFSFLPTTGQVVIRDKAENVHTAQKLISDFNAKFKDTIAGRITFYKVTMDKTDKRGLDLKALIGTHFSLSSSGMIGSAFPSTGLAGGNLNIGLNSGDSTSLLQFLKQVGTTEVVNSIDFETQSNSIKTIKIANNYGYISSVNSNQIAGSNGTTTSGGITPSSVPDGTFASLITKKIGNGMIAFDIYATSNSLSKFNTADAFGTSVQTPDTAEQSVDGYHQVRPGVPYILLSYKYNETSHDQQGFPIGFDWMQKIGVNSDGNKDVFIIVALEATVK